ncbi:GNAT family N-acetyltransferase [Clostridium sp. MCC353]|uniref:GNAT family N-acetyltransferase n=1 Tax=Clostridium sp. MCC353 TaxID=2592646 RepID=UPI001C033F02|nr:GNAT family N-acetyltransferase [Clostridium sp. MCC353]MBT9777855.1 GNAT family N-acetyltransferase [Clostridium sp. MCC353]
MRIDKIEDNSKQNFMDLLLLADEDVNMIEKYLYRGELFALYDDDLKSVCVVTRESAGVCELKNIATYEKWHKKGYGSLLLNHVFSYYKGKYQTMLVGTGDVPWIMNFYQNNGFRISHRIKNFFTDNYDHPMYDGDVQLADMVYLSKDL